MKLKNKHDEYAARFEETDFLKQIGNTVSGKPISPEQFNASISDIKNALEITNNDFILDMCCGNGLRTFEIAKICKSIVGIDISQHLINIAKKYFNRENIIYYCMSVLDNKLERLFSEPVTKVFMYSGLQCFNKPDLDDLLKQINKLSNSSAVIFWAAIPDIDKIWSFYNTDEKREAYLKRRNKNQDIMGTWWNKEEIADTCTNNGFKVQFLSQNELVDTAYYRFDVRLTK